jgi:hypothetical protein
MNTISTYTYRRKYFQNTLAILLRRALISEAVFNVDRTEDKYIDNPYGSSPTASVTAINGTYSVNTYTTTDDTLTVADEIKAGEHVYGFENILSNFDLFASRMEQIMFAVKDKADAYALNVITEGATGSYSTPAGGFGTSTNVTTIFGNLISKVSGYSEISNGMFLVIENTEIPGLIVAQAASGFSFADSVYKNGFMNSYMGVDIYVTRTGTFADDTFGTQTFTNAGHRLFGIKKVATFASPRGVNYEEKQVSGKTGMEIVAYALVGAKAWASKSDLLIDITLTA